MPLDSGVSALLTHEYARFQKGVANLDPETRAAWQAAYGRGGLRPGETPTITIPGWNDIIQTGPRLQTTTAQRREFWDAAHGGREPNLPPEIVHAIAEREAFLEAMRTSGNPAYLKGFGEILTAIDNVQDLASTVATLGRLVLWGAPRLAGRFVPVVGWVVLASDLLNMLSFLGTVATPLYALLCMGPRNALAAGVPGMVFKRALKAEAWKMMLRNPFSRRGRAATRLKAAGRLPGITNLIEVAQVTQSLWGYGLSLGGLVGMFFETTFAIERGLRGEPTRINNHLIPALPRPLGAAAPGHQDRYDLVDLQRAAGVLAGAPKLLQHPSAWPDDFVLLTLVTLAAAVTTLADALDGVEWRDAFAERAPGSWAPVLQDDPFTDGYLELRRGAALRPQGHAMPGEPRIIDGDRYVNELGPRCTEGMTAWLRARRNTAAGCLAGTLINATAENLWALIAGDAHAFRWELATDARLIASLCEEGYLVNTAEPLAAVWGFWQDARRALEVAGATRLPPASWLRLAEARGLTLIKLLPGDTPWPPEWAEFQAQTPGLPLTAQTDA